MHFIDRRHQNWWMAAVLLQDRKTLPPVLPSRDTKADWHWRDGLVPLPRLHRNMPTLKYYITYFVLIMSLIMLFSKVFAATYLETAIFHWNCIILSICECDNYNVPTSHLCVLLKARLQIINVIFVSNINLVYVIQYKSIIVDKLIALSLNWWEYIHDACTCYMLKLYLCSSVIV